MEFVFPRRLLFAGRVRKEGCVKTQVACHGMSVSSARALMVCVWVRFARFGHRVSLTFQIGPGKAGIWCQNEMGAAAGEGRRDGREDMRADGGSRVWQPRAIIAHHAIVDEPWERSALDPALFRGRYPDCRSSSQRRCSMGTAQQRQVAITQMP